MNTKEYRIFGPPGTGKTTFLSRQIVNAVEARGSDAILVASFTKAAAVELGSRGLPVNPNNIGTLHALCYHILGMPPIAETKVKEFNNEYPEFRLTATDVDKDEPEQKFETETDETFFLYQIYRARMVEREKWGVQVQAFAKVWEEWKWRHGYIDFTDMIEMVYQQGLPPLGFPEIGFFDEVQDFTLLELSLVRMWAQHLDYIVLAGDDDQCIYDWKGASSLAFLQPEIPEDRIRILAQSYRIPRAVYDYSQEWILQVKERQIKPFNPRAEPGELIRRPDFAYRVPDKMVDEIAQRADAGERVMVIGACSYMITPIIKELRTRGELFYNPYRTKRGDWNPLGATRKGTVSTRDRLLAFLRPNPDVWGQDRRPWTYSEVRRWIPLVKKQGVFRRGMAKVFEAGAEDEPVPADVILNVAEPGAAMPMLKGDLNWLLRNAATDKVNSLAYPAQVGQNKGWHRLYDEPNIIVGTIHSVKGGEADTVYLLPDLSRPGMEQYISTKRNDGVLRQFYVGMTRAKQNLILCGSSSANSAVDW